MSINDELKVLLDELEVYGYTIKRVARETSYEVDTIRKALRGKVTDKMYNKIKALHVMAQEKAHNPVSDIHTRVKRIEATQDVILTMLADVLAKLTNRSSAIIKSEYDKLIEERSKD